MSAIANLLRGLGSRVGTASAGLCSASWRMLLVHSGQPFLPHPPDDSREIYFGGVLSLLIVLVSGLFRRAGARLQGYGRCSGMVRRALGVLRGLVRSPASSAPWSRRCCSRAGPAISSDGRDRPPCNHQSSSPQWTAMPRNPIARVVAPRFWGVISMPILAALFGDGHPRRCHRRLHRRRMTVPSGRR